MTSVGSDNSMRKPGEHGGRLIVRNLPFGFTEKQMKKLAEKIGQVKDVTLPWDQEKKRNKGFAFLEFEKKNVSEKAIKELNGKTIQHRVLSVDWALSKTMYEKALKSEDFNQSFKPKGPKPAESTEPDPPPAAVPAVPTAHYSEAELLQQTAPAKPAAPANRLHKDRTLFVKNLKYEVDDDDLRDYFAQFGDLRYAKVVYSQETNQSKGTGFVCFQKKEGADKALAALGSGQTPGPEMELEGRIPEVCVAVSREEAVKIEPKKKKVDTRNLALSKEGIVMPGTPQFDALSPEDIEKRMSYARSKNQKLKNPNIFVSKTRVLLRNLPKSLTDTRLKTQARQLLLTLDPEAKNRKLFSQVKILKDPNRLDEQGELRSKGFGFVEFKEHQDALRFVRKVSEVPTLFGGKKQVMAEFALDDVRMLRLRQLRLERQRKKIQELKAAAKESQDDPAPKKLSRGQRQRLKRKQQRESQGSDPAATESTSDFEVLNTHTVPSVRSAPAPQPSSEAPKKKRHQPKKNKPKARQPDEFDVEVMEFDEEPRKRRKDTKRTKEDEDLEKLVTDYRNKLFAAL